MTLDKRSLPGFAALFSMPLAWVILLLIVLGLTAVQFGLLRPKGDRK